MSAVGLVRLLGESLNDLSGYGQAHGVHSFFRARILNENFNSSFTFSAPPATEASFRS